MKTKSRFSIAARGMFLWALVMGTTALIVMPPEIWAHQWTESKTLGRTLLYKSKSENIQTPNISQATSKNLQTPNISHALHAKVELFYPTKGQSSDGNCWMGLRIDSHDNVYPSAGDIYKILPNGTLVNGVNDQNLFMYGGGGGWFELDERGGNFYLTPYFVNDHNIYVAPFVNGSSEHKLIEGFDSISGITLGRGSLAGSLFVTEPFANQVSRITLSSLELNVFASGAAFFNSPDAIASAQNGTLYVVNGGFTTPKLTKITSAGVPSTFAIGTFSQVNDAVIVDKDRNVYWSHENGFNKYDARGNLLGILPLPPVVIPPPIDYPTYTYHWNPMGSAFDSKGNLYVVNNWECKTIYKYTIPNTKNQCKNGGWKAFGFKNHGRCIEYVDKHDQWDNYNHDHGDK